MCCKCCTKQEDTLITNVYGQTLCEDCWFDYLFTDDGMIEHFIWLVTGKALVDWYDADFLGEVVNSWNNNKHLLGWSEEVIDEFEAIAICLNIF